MSDKLINELEIFSVMEIDKNLILKIAHVSRIRLSGNEVQQMVPELQEILKTFDYLQKVNTDGIEPSFHPIPVKNKLREDIPKIPLTQKQALQNSTNNSQGYFKGPRAI